VSEAASLHGKRDGLAGANTAGNRVDIDNIDRKNESASRGGIEAFTPSDYVSLGWKLFPCHHISDGVCSCGDMNCDSPGKHPRTANGVKAATGNLDQLRSWWQQFPGCNWGLATGQPSGVVVIDIDQRKGGFDSFDEYEQNRRAPGDFGSTLVAATGGGGRHILLKPPPGVQVKNRVNWRPGVDIRGDGGYVILAPGNHISGGFYEWVNWGTSVMDAPEDWLRDAGTGGGSNSGDSSIKDLTVDSFLGGIEEGARDDTLFKMACRLRRQLNDNRAAVTILVLAAAANSSPPFPEKDALKKIEQAFLQDHSDEYRSPFGAPDSMASYSLADVARSMEGERIDWLIKGVWLTGGYGMVAGAEKTLKSYLTILFALSVASGRAIRPEWEVNKARPVLVFTGEGGRKLWLRRARHLGSVLNLSRADVDALPVVIIDGIQPLSSQAFESTLTAQIAGTPELGLVIIDPFYSYQGEDAAQAGNVMVAGQKLARLNSLVTEHGIALMIVNHFTKAGAGVLSLSSITQAGPREWSDTWVLLGHRKTPDVERGEFHMRMVVGSRQGFGRDLDVSWHIGRFNEDTLEHEGEPSFSVGTNQPAESRFSPMAQKVLQFIVDNDKSEGLPLSRGGIAVVKELGGSKGAREKGLNELIAAGLVTVEEYKNPANGRIVHGYRRALSFENEFADLLDSCSDAPQMDLADGVA
jgi:hypothetical protein